jgi:hypothetical protein
MKEPLKIVSHLPAVSFELEGKFWIAAGAQWIEVDRIYTPKELEKIWVKEKPKYQSTSVPKESKPKTFKVAGSKGKEYIVQNKGSQWSCNCPASTFRRWEDCKHIIQIKKTI